MRTIPANARMVWTVRERIVEPTDDRPPQRAAVPDHDKGPSLGGGAARHQQFHGPDRCPTKVLFASSSFRGLVDGA